MESGTSDTSLRRDTDERFVPLRRELGVSSFGINQIVLQPGQRMRIHRHANQEEVYVVLAGTLTLLIEGDGTDYGPDQLIRVAPDVRRQLANRGPEPLILLALGGAGDHQSRDAEAFTAWDQQTGAGPQDVPLPPDLDPGRAPVAQRAAASATSASTSPSMSCRVASTSGSRPCSRRVALVTGPMLTSRVCSTERITGGGEEVLDRRG